ncbi:MAG: SPOR domain-containing protein, partial [Tepidimonas sp.]
MLRAVVILLLIANGALWAWRHGYLGNPGEGGMADATREPQRLSQQVEPQRLRLLNPAGSTAAHLTTAVQASPPDAAPLA